MIACTIADSLQAEQFLWKTRRQYGTRGPSTLISKTVNPATARSTHAFASYSPLHFAAIFGRLDTVRVLLTYRANCCARNSNLHTPADVAMESGHFEVCRELEKYCAESQETSNFTSDSADSAYDSTSCSDISANMSFCCIR